MKTVVYLEEISRYTNHPPTHYLRIKSFFQLITFSRIYDTSCKKMIYMPLITISIHIYIHELEPLTSKIEGKKGKCSVFLILVYR